MFSDLNRGDGGKLLGHKGREKIEDVARCEMPSCNDGGFKGRYLYLVNSPKARALVLNSELGLVAYSDAWSTRRLAFA